MKRMIADCGRGMFSALALAGAAAFGGEFTWSGGASGAWGDAANWGGAGVPNAGDVAVFNSDATINADFAIAEGALVVSNFEKSVTFDCTISGAGKLCCFGDGDFHLKRDNFFTGGFVADGARFITYSQENAGVSVKNKCRVHLYTSAGLGSGKAEICTGTATSTGSGAGLLVEETNLTVTNEVVFGWNSNGGYSIYFSKKGTVTFAGDFSWPMRLALSPKQSGSVVRFAKSFHGGSNWFQPSGGIVVHMDCVMESPKTTYYATSSSQLHLHRPGNTWGYCYGCDGPIHLWTTNAFPSQTSTRLQLSSSSGVVHLHGFDQTVTKLPALVMSKSSSGFESDAPALMRFEGKDVSSLTFAGSFSGAAGLCWNPSGEKEFCFTNTVQPTAGELLVSNGTVRVKYGAGFSALSNLVVAAGAKFAVDANANARVTAENVAVAEGGAVELPAGSVMSCVNCTTNGASVASGIYSADDLAGFSGEGTVFVFDKPDTGAKWIGAAGGSWNDGANWANGETPSAGAVVFVANAGSVAFPADAPRFARVVVENGTTLVATNWSTCFGADVFEIRNGGKVTCAGPFTNETESARVWISCGELRLYEGGAIDVVGRGWSAGPHTGSSQWKDGWWGRPGFGPGAGVRCKGASHGGFGGLLVGDNGVFPTPEYDSAEEPSEAGSGGYGYNGAVLSNGGGAVRVEVTGAARIDGTINADAVDVLPVNERTYALSSAGAGGSVWISCATVSGKGAVSAEGGNGSRGFYPVWTFPQCYTNSSGSFSYWWGARPGGGGRIAVHYDASAQTVAAASSLTFSAKAGVHKTSGSSFSLTEVTADDFRNGADLGTVWFTDETLLKATFGRGLSGRVVNMPKTFEIDGDFTFADGWVRLPAEGVTLKVNGNLAVDGANTRLELGGAYATNRTAYVEIYGGVETNFLVVGGDFAVTGGAGFDVRSGGVTTDPARVGAVVSVGGDMTVGDKSRVVCWSDAHDLSSPRFVVGGDFEVSAGGLVTAEFRGASGAWMDDWYKSSILKSTSWFGIGAGGGVQTAGASYGGVGGTNFWVGLKDNATGGQYGDAFRPFECGSGGGTYYNGRGGSGGGVVHVTAVGNLVVDGTVNACGQATPDSSLREGAGAGGTIFLAGRNFTGAGRLVADGGLVYQDGEADAKSTHCAAAGGGGRIAVWTGEPYDTGLDVDASRSRRVTRSTAPLANLDDVAAFSGTASAIAGTNTVTFTMPDVCVGTAGSVEFCRLRKPWGTAILVR